MPRGIYIRTKEWRAVQSASHKGKKLSAETRSKISVANKGRKLSAEHKAKISAAQKVRVRASGEEHYNWKGGLSSIPYPFNFSERLKDLIRERDGYICQLCSKTQEENGKKLSVHHIDYVKENLDPENLISLCCGCNSKVNQGRKSWIRFFQLKLKLRIG